MSLTNMPNEEKTSFRIWRSIKTGSNDYWCHWPLWHAILQYHLMTIYNNQSINSWYIHHIKWQHGLSRQNIVAFISNHNDKWRLQGYHCIKVLHRFKLLWKILIIKTQTNVWNPQSCNIYNVNIHYFYNSMEVKKNLKITEKIRKYNPPADQTESKWS